MDTGDGEIDRSLLLEERNRAATTTTIPNRKKPDYRKENIAYGVFMHGVSANGSSTQ